MKSSPSQLELRDDLEEESPLRRSYNVQNLVNQYLMEPKKEKPRSKSRTLDGYVLLDAAGVSLPEDVIKIGLVFFVFASSLLLRSYFLFC
jgi:hypothetical protein